MDHFFSKHPIKKITTYLSIVTFVAALTQKCYCTTSFCGDSFMALLSGTIGIFFGGTALTWLANPLLIVSWFKSKSSKTSLICSLFAVVLSLSFLFFKKVINDEAGNYSAIVSYQLGYWLWIASSIIMLIGNSIVYFKSKSP